MRSDVKSDRERGASVMTDIRIARTEGNICIHTVTDADKDDYINFDSSDGFAKRLSRDGTELGIALQDILWNERCKLDGIMFAIQEISEGKTIGFCDIDNISSDEPTIGIRIAQRYRGKGYGYLAAKMMIEEGWKLFRHPYFVWELDQDNVASRRLILKLGGKYINNRTTMPQNMINCLQSAGIAVNENDYPASVERYKIERPKGY